MDPVTFALISTGVTALGAGGTSFLNYGVQKKLDKKNYKRQLEMLYIQQQFAERMANTAHQREVRDLRAAGLNPILSSLGSGAASPTVSASPVSSGSSAGVDLGNLGSAFMDAASAYSKIQKEEADTKLAESMIETEKAKQSELNAKTQTLNAELPNKQIKNLAAKEAINHGVKPGIFDRVFNSVSRAFKPDSYVSSGKIVRSTGKTVNSDLTSKKILSPKMSINPYNSHSKDDHGKYFRDEKGRPYKFHYYKDGVYKYEYLD